jgi:cation diffusion facilitator family transporter
MNTDNNLDNKSIDKYHSFWNKINLHRDVNENKYIFMLILTSGFFFVELIVGLSIKSIILQADSFHMLSDSFALAIGYSSLKMKKYNRNSRATYGYLRAEIIASLINSVFLLSSCFSLFTDIIYRFFNIGQNKELEEGIYSLIIVATLGFIINLIGLFLFDVHNNRNEKNNNLNHSSIYLNILGDLMASVITLISSIIILCTSGIIKFLIDPIFSLLLIIMISYSSFKILRKSVYILLNFVPIEINYNKIKEDIQEIENISDNRCLHIWSLNQKDYVASVHIRIKDINLINETINDVKLLFNKNNISFVTIQPEFDNLNDSDIEEKEEIL